MLCFAYSPVCSDPEVQLKLNYETPFIFIRKILRFHRVPLQVQAPIEEPTTVVFRRPNDWPNLHILSARKAYVVSVPTLYIFDFPGLFLKSQLWWTIPSEFTLNYIIVTQLYIHDDSSYFDF